MFALVIGGSLLSLIGNLAVQDVQGTELVSFAGRFIRMKLKYPSVPGFGNIQEKAQQAQVEDRGTVRRSEGAPLIEAISRSRTVEIPNPAFHYSNRTQL